MCSLPLLVAGRGSRASVSTLCCGADLVLADPSGCLLGSFSPPASHPPSLTGPPLALAGARPWASPGAVRRGPPGSSLPVESDFKTSSTDITPFASTMHSPPRPCLPRRRTPARWSLRLLHPRLPTAGPTSHTSVLSLRHVRLRPVSVSSHHLGGAVAVSYL